jgi:hypothetical protein
MGSVAEADLDGGELIAARRDEAARSIEADCEREPVDLLVAERWIVRVAQHGDAGVSGVVEIDRNVIGHAASREIIS